MPQYSVYTAGHGTLSWDEFLQLLAPFHLEQLVDVRPYPYVELTPWFNRDRLEHLVRREGWEYLWLGGQLGPLTSDGRVDYIAKEREGRYHDGISQLLALAGERRTCLLGSQLDPMDSHRHLLLAQTLLKHDVGVLHILEGGQLQPAQADLFHSLVP